jgi:CRISPR type III-B/RAMP module-associated protein Cmr5
MDNLDQIRAQNALAIAKTIEKKHVTKIPALIVNNGLLAAIAFSAERKDNGQPKRPELKLAVDGVARHLSHQTIGRLGIEQGKADADAMLTELTGATSENLRLATNEALAYLSFLKRFAK